MDTWSTTDWVTGVIFLVVTAIGIVNWIKFQRTSELGKARFLFDVSVAARWGLVDVLILAFVWLASQAVTLQVLAALGGMEVGQKLSSDQAARFAVIIGIVQLVVVGLSLVYLANRYQHSGQDFGLEPDQFKSGVRSGLIAFTMWIPVVWAVQTVLVYFIEYSHPSFDRINQSTNPRTIFDAWISAVIIAPIVEEILFRGIIQGWLQRIRKDARHDPNALVLGGAIKDDAQARATDPKKPSEKTIHIPAILFTSLLFGLAHFSQGPAPISLFVLSTGLGYLYQRTGSLVACIVVHMLLNAITMSLFTIDVFTA